MCRREPLQLIRKKQRFQFVNNDLAGPFKPVTKRGNRYVLIIVDNFSQWPELRICAIEYN